MAGQNQLYTSSAIVNGQLVPSTRSALYYPMAVGPIIQGVPAGPQQSSGGYVGGGPVQGGASSGGSASAAAAAPFDFINSPVPMLIIMFLAGYLLLRFIHYPY